MLHIRLQQARKAAGLSLRELAERVGVSHAAIKKYEDGAVTPASDMLLKLSQALGVRVAYFFRPQTVVLDGLEYRKHSALPKKRLNAITHAVIDQIERRMELENLFPQPPKAFVTPEGLPTITDMAQIELVAELVRKAWQLGMNPIPDLVGTLEVKGIRVFVTDDDGDKHFDGLAARAGDVPVVVVGRHWPGDRQRFTLAHELGHLLLEKRLGVAIDAELACNRFAGAFLFPRVAVLQELGAHRNAIELQELALLKGEYGLSMGGILYRASELGIVSATYRQAQVEHFKAKGWHLTEPGLPYPAEKAHHFEQLVFHALAEDYIGESKAAELMGLPLAQFHRIRQLDATVEQSHAGVHQ
jgi:Zn-dependent peptidase ImmA (M78 family)/transcriptional regulator with XRE-family HTH domain